MLRFPPAVGVLTNSKTNVRYNTSRLIPRRGLPATGRGMMMKLTVFDVLGKQVASLHEGYLSAGSYEVTFDGSNLPSGAYYYRLTTDGYSETRAMVLLK